MSSRKLIILTKALMGSDDDQRAYLYRDKVMKVPGVISADSFRCADHPGGPSPYRWGCMVTYDHETTDVRQVIEGAVASSGNESELGGATREPDSVTYFEPVTEFRRKTEFLRDNVSRGTGPSEQTNADLARVNAGRESEPYLTRWRLADVATMRLEDWAGAVVGPTYLEENLQIPRSTLHRWQKRNLGRHVFPLAQFVDGRPVAGIPEVFALAKQPRLAWSWLVRPSPYLEGSIPIDLLRRDLVDEVVIAAKRSF
ncbi:hypothetical protein [Mesorhizobium sp. M0228]|uniref:antitoxin Xre/MbcA/ParS-like domain-containing protein n=1 Tax=Mesorhizobium sp. M0228 TaxID=2956923 RepID=UPI00333D4776